MEDEGFNTLESTLTSKGNAILKEFNDLVYVVCQV